MKRARRWDRIASDVAAKLLRAIQALPDNELRVLSTFADRASGRNCAWFAYAVREFMSKEAVETLKWRKSRAKERAKP